VWKVTGSAASQRRKVSIIGRWDNEELSFLSNRAENPTGFTMVGGFIEMSPAAKCFTYVRKNPGCSTRAVRNEVGLKHENAKRELEALKAEGFLTDEGHGRHHLWTAVEDWVVSPDGQRIISQSDIRELDTEVAP
jgi:predicted HTH transcriptional regulator